MPSMSFTSHPTTYAPVRSVEPHINDHRPTAKASELYRERPVPATSRVAALADDEDDPSLPESPPERCSRTSVGRALVAYLMPLVLLPMPLILRENVSLRVFCSTDTNTLALLVELRLTHTISIVLQRWWCLYVLLLMVLFWVTECIPVAVTGLLPALILPLAGVMGIKDLAPDYWKARR